MSTIRATFVQHGSSAVPNITLNASGQVIVASGIVSSGTFAAPSGSVSAPGIYFNGDSNTGLYSPAADTIAFTEGGVEALRIDSSGRVGIGTSSPGAALSIGDTSTTASNQIRMHGPASGTAGGSSINVVNGINTIFAAGNASNIIGGSYSSDAMLFWGNADLRFYGNSAERARIDSSGRLLVGTSSARSNFFNTTSFSPQLQLEGTGTAQILSVTSSDTVYGPYLILARQKSGSVGGNTLVGNNDLLGSVDFQGSDGTEFIAGGQIRCEVDGTPGANDMPGRLVFSVTRDGSASPTEAMRINNQGGVNIDSVSSNTTNSLYLAHSGGGNPGILLVSGTNGTYAGNTIESNITRAATSAASVFKGFSGNFADAEFNLRGDGNGYCDGSWTGGGADYAEYFEWSDSNPNAEDRRGISVVLNGDKIREAQAGEDPIGVISGNPSVVGDSAWNKWSGKYLRDEFGTYIQEDYEVTDDDGNTVIQQRRKLNPAYNPDVEYISREQRPEWDCVGLMGKLRIRKGQVTGSRWIKMRDISDSVEEWLVR